MCTRTHKMEAALFIVNEIMERHQPGRDQLVLEPEMIDFRIIVHTTQGSIFRTDSLNKQLDIQQYNMLMLIFVDQVVLWSVLVIT